MLLQRMTSWFGSARAERAPDAPDRPVAAPGRSARLDKARAVKRTAEAIGFTVVLLGLYFTYTEAKRANAGQNLENWSEVTSRTFDIDRVFVEYPGFQKYVYDGAVAEKGSADHDRALAISVMQLDYFDSVTSRIAYNREYLSNDILQQDAWYHYIETTLATAPMMCAILLADPRSYGTEMRKVGVPPCRRAAAARSAARKRQAPLVRS